MWILSCVPRQPPASMGEDAEGRSIEIINVDAEITRGSDTRSFAHVLAQHLGDEAEWVPGTNLFVGAAALIPRGESPAIRIRDNPGGPSISTYGDAHTILQVSAQVDLRHDSRPMAAAIGWELHALLTIHNRDLS